MARLAPKYLELFSTEEEKENRNRNRVLRIILTNRHSSFWVIPTMMIHTDS